MEIEYYEVYDEHDHLLASHLTRDNALIFMDALFVKYYRDEDLCLSIRRSIPNESNDTNR